MTMKEKIFGAVKIFMACWLVQFVLGWIIGGVYGTAVSISDYGPSIGLFIGIALVVGLAVGMIFAIKSLFQSGIRNFQD